MQKKNFKNEGFTLVELLVVIAIIGLLSTLSIVALNNARMKARDAVRVANIKQMQTAFELYYNDAGKYPTTTIAGLGGSVRYNGAIYMAIVPTDPSPQTEGACSSFGGAYTYATTTNSSSYQLRYCLGGSSGGVTAGCHNATPAGIADGGVGCP
jgi:prepilin-type N-terminal cleavage/methylation domain-containing protein